MRSTTRDRLLLPVLMPIGILVVIAAVLFGFSRILLSVSHGAATATALAVAFGIMVVSGVVAGRAVVKPSHLASMVGAIAGVAMVAGGIALVTIAPATSEGGGSAATLHLVAKDIAFDQTKLSAPAGKGFTIAFDNQDAGLQHNVQIFDNKDFSGDPVFDGELTTGPEQIDYEVPALDAGTYYFRCVVHPSQMTGELDVVEGGGGAGGGGPTVTVSAKDIQFDTSQIELPADTPATIHFQNDDAGIQHNIAIFPSEKDLQDPVFRGDLVTGPGAVDYQIPPLKPGTYYFHCDVHPTMNGKVVVSGAGGGGGPSATPSGGGGAGGGGGGPTTTSVTAEGIKFGISQIDLPANQAVTLTFENKDAGIQHNIAIFKSESDLSNPLFRGEVITGPATVQYQIPALPPGTYYFHCDIHPTMNGTVVVG
ncbi:MAG TPA: cupredoxin domain-containing protein [Actinomycetota bacterium]|jgi:plastocyanin|nr:cupredoxin domain-containing protein [Actinomycetota bacterium]